MNKVTFDDYWLGYLAGHADPLTRVLHYSACCSNSCSVFIARSQWPGGGADRLLAQLPRRNLSHEWIEGNSNKLHATRPLWGWGIC